MVLAAPDEQHPLAKLEIEIGGVAGVRPVGACGDDEPLLKQQVADDRLDDGAAVGRHAGSTGKARQRVVGEADLP